MTGSLPDGFVRQDLIRRTFVVEWPDSVCCASNPGICAVSSLG